MWFLISEQSVLDIKVELPQQQETRSKIVFFFQIPNYVRWYRFNHIKKPFLCQHSDTQFHPAPTFKSTHNTSDEVVSPVQEPELTRPGFTTVLIHLCELNCVLAGNQVLLWSPPYSASDWLASWLRLIQTVSSHSRSVNVCFLRFISCSCSGKHTDLFGFSPWQTPTPVFVGPQWRVPLLLRHHPACPLQLSPPLIKGWNLFVAAAFYWNNCKTLINLFNCNITFIVLSLLNLFVWSYLLLSTCFNV